MDTEKAITTEFAIKIIENELKVPFRYGDKIITLLKRDEKSTIENIELKKFKQMWKVYRDKIAFFKSSKEMREFEKIYFPKEEKELEEEIDTWWVKLSQEGKKEIAEYLGYIKNPNEVWESLDYKIKLDIFREENSCKPLKGGK